MAVTLIPKSVLYATGVIERDLMWVTTSKIGALPVPYFSPKTLLARLEWYRFILRLSLVSPRDNAMFARIESAILDLSTDCSDGSLRKQPFCVVLYGKPGVGKSSYAIELARKLMCSRYGGFNSYDMVTLNESDEFQSEFRTSHKVVLFDDIGAAPMDLSDTKNPWRKVIDFVNNIKKTALNPNCEMKGKVYIQPDLVILTTNINIPEASTHVARYITCSEAIYRRFNAIIEVLSFDTSVFSQVEKTSDLGSCTLGSRHSRCADDGVVSRTESLITLEKLFIEHMSAQELFVSTFNNHFDDLKMEYETPVLAPHCGVCKKTVELPPILSERILSCKTYLQETLDGRLYLAYRESWTEDHHFRVFEGVIYSFLHMNVLAHTLSGIDYVSDGRVRFGYVYTCAELDAEMTRRFSIDTDTPPDIDPPPPPTGLKAESEEIDLSLTDSDSRSVVWGLTPFEATSPDYRHYILSNTVIKLVFYIYYWDHIEDLMPHAGHRDRPLWLHHQEYCSDLTYSYSPEFLRSLLRQYVTSIYEDRFPFPADRTSVFNFVASVARRCNFSRKEHYDHDNPTSLTSPPKLDDIKVAPLEEQDYLLEPESSQIDRFLSVLPLPPSIVKGAYKNLKFGANFGEIDILLESGSDCLLLVEVKRSTNYQAYARKQVIKYCHMMELLQPHRRIFGMTYTYAGLAVEFDNANPYSPTPLKELFDLISYTPKEVPESKKIPATL